VALKVKDVAASAQWYEHVLGLKPYTFPEWGDFPVFMLVGKTGIALFPAVRPQVAPQTPSQADGPHIHHFAFQVDGENFAAARRQLERLGIAYILQDHHFFHSLYFHDPDGYQVGLTTQVVAEDQFYQCGGAYVHQRRVRSG
jgi:catechol 2,3-dioxygenase-like lactoylglutathione lyase family enzyme